jgi:hypothetical protein
MGKSSKRRKFKKKTDPVKDLVHFFGLVNVPWLTAKSTPGGPRRTEIQVKLMKEGVRSMKELLLLSEKDLEATELIAVEKALVKIAVGCYRYYVSIRPEDTEPYLHCDKETMVHYRTSIYEPNKPDTWLSNSPGTEGSTFWKKAIRPTASDYRELRDGMFWHRWERRFRTTLKSHGLSHMIKKDYYPTDPDTHEIQTAFVFKVLDDKVTDSPGKLIVAEHYDNPDIYTIWTKLVKYYEHSVMAETKRAKLSTLLTSSRLDANWSGTQEKFITVWQETSNQYNDISPNPMPPPQLIDFLKAAVAPQENLQHVHTRLTQGMRAMSIDPSKMPLEYYVSSLLEAAQIHDAAKGEMKSKRTRSVNVLEQHVHEMEYLEDEADTVLMSNVHQSSKNNRRGPRKALMNKATWDSLPKSEQELWDKISEEGKTKILDYIVARKSRNEESLSANNHDIVFDDDDEIADDTKLSVGIHEQNDPDTMKANVHDARIPGPEDLAQERATDMVSDSLDLLTTKWGFYEEDDVRIPTKLSVQQVLSKPSKLEVNMHQYYDSDSEDSGQEDEETPPPARRPSSIPSNEELYQRHSRSIRNQRERTQPLLPWAGPSDDEDTYSGMGSLEDGPSSSESEAESENDDDFDYQPQFANDDPQVLEAQEELQQLAIDGPLSVNQSNEQDEQSDEPSNHAGLRIVPYSETRRELATEGFDIPEDVNGIRNLPPMLVNSQGQPIPGPRWTGQGHRIVNSSNHQSSTADYNVDDMDCIVRIRDKNDVIHCGYRLDGEVYRIPRSDGSQPPIIYHTTELEVLGVPDNAPSSMDIEILEERTGGNSQDQVDEDIQDVHQEASSDVDNDVKPITKKELQEHQSAIDHERATLLARLDELAQAEINWNIATGTMVLVDDDGIPLGSEDKMSDASEQDDTTHGDLPALDRIHIGLEDNGTHEPDEQHDVTDTTFAEQDLDTSDTVSANDNEENTSLNYKQMLLKEGGNPYQAKPRDSTSGTNAPTINRTRSEDIGGSQPWEVVPGRNKKKKKDEAPPRNFLDRPNKDVRREKNEPASPSDDSTISPTTSVASAPNASVNSPTDRRTKPLNVLKHRKVIQAETGSEQGSNYKTPSSKGRRGKNKAKSLAQAVCETMASPFGRNSKSPNESDSSPSNESANSKNSKGSKDSKGGKSNRQNKKKDGSDFH